MSRATARLASVLDGRVGAAALVRGSNSCIGVGIAHDARERAAAVGAVHHLAAAGGDETSSLAPIRTRVDPRAPAGRGEAGDPEESPRG